MNPLIAPNSVLAMRHVALAAQRPSSTVASLIAQVGFATTLLQLTDVASLRFHGSRVTDRVIEELTSAHGDATSTTATQLALLVHWTEHTEPPTLKALRYLTRGAIAVLYAARSIRAEAH